LGVTSNDAARNGVQLGRRIGVRGHFKMQRHGRANTLRKLIYVASHIRGNMDAPPLHGVVVLHDRPPLAPHPTNKSAKIPHPTRRLPDSRSTTGRIRFGTGTGRIAGGRDVCGENRFIMVDRQNLALRGTQTSLEYRRRTIKQRL
jgi:hypothetical protein